MAGWAERSTRLAGWLPGRTRTVLGPTDHVVVVGAGLAGLSAAMRLAGAGRQVTLLERETVPGGRAGQPQGRTAPPGRPPPRPRDRWDPGRYGSGPAASLPAAWTARPSPSSGDPDRHRRDEPAERAAARGVHGSGCEVP